MATRTAPATVLPFMRGGYRMRAKREKQASNTYMSQIIIIKFLLGTAFPVASWERKKSIICPFSQKKGHTLGKW